MSIAQFSDSPIDILPSAPIKTEVEQFCEAGVQSISYFAEKMNISPRTLSRLLDGIPFSGNYRESGIRSIRCLEFTEAGAKRLLEEVKKWKMKKETNESLKIARIVAKDALEIVEAKETGLRFGVILERTGESKGLMRKYWTYCTGALASRGWFKMSSSWPTPTHALLPEHYEDFIKGLLPYKEALREDMRRRTEKKRK